MALQLGKQKKKTASKQTICVLTTAGLAPIVWTLACSGTALHEILDGGVWQGEEVGPPCGGHYDLRAARSVHGTQQSHVALVRAVAHKGPLGQVLGHNLELKEEKAPGSHESPVW